MPSIHSVAQMQHKKQERIEFMKNQITLKQLLLVSTADDINVYLRDVNCMDIERIIYCDKDTNNDRSSLKAYLDYVVVSVDENWNIVVKGQKMA